MKQKGLSMRSSNIEICRIVSMVCIVAFHSVLYGGQEKAELYKNAISLNMCLIYLFGVGGVFGVDLFVIITSFFSRINRSRTPDVRRLVQMSVQCWMICISLSVLFKILLKADMSTNTIIKELTSPVYNQYWFVTTYICFVFLIPFLNILCKNLSDKQSLLLLVVLAVISNVFGVVFTSQTGNIGTFVYIYFFVEYLQRKENLIRKHKYTIFFSMWGINTCLLIACNILGRVSGHSVFFDIMFKAFRSDNNIFILIMAMAFFYIFLDMKCNNSVIINSISAGTLGVYLFHENILMNGVYNSGNSFLWEQLLHMSEIIKQNSFVVIWPLYVLIVFAIGWVYGSVFDVISGVLVKKNRIVSLFCDYIESKYNSLYIK